MPNYANSRSCSTVVPDSPGISVARADFDEGSCRSCQRARGWRRTTLRHSMCDRCDRSQSGACCVSERRRTSCDSDTDANGDKGSATQDAPRLPRRRSGKSAVGDSFRRLAHPAHTSRYTLPTTPTPQRLHRRCLLHCLHRRRRLRGCRGYRLEVEPLKSAQSSGCLRPARRWHARPRVLPRRRGASSDSGRSRGGRRSAGRALHGKSPPALATRRSAP